MTIPVILAVLLVAGIVTAVVINDHQSRKQNPYNYGVHPSIKDGRGDRVGSVRIQTALLTESEIRRLLSK